jgi:hypothetical protein
MLHDKIEFFKVLDWPYGIVGNYLNDEQEENMIKSTNNKTCTDLLYMNEKQTQAHWDMIDNLY